VVAADRFLRAQKQLRRPARFYADNDLLDILTAIWCKEGRLVCT